MHLRDRLSNGGRTVKCMPLERTGGEMFRTDASAHEDYAIIGGWETAKTEDPKRARWFSHKVTKSDIPELFKQGDAKRTTAGWELLATIVAMKIFFPQSVEGEGRGTVVGTGTTDNQGNPFILNRLMTTKFPVNVMLMEAATIMEARSQWLDLTWTPRESNVEADDLSNERLEKFAAENRVNVQIDQDRFPVMFKMLAHGRALFDELEQRKRRNKEDGINVHDVKKKKKTVEKKSW